MRNLICVIALLCFATVANAGPFGIFGRSACGPNGCNNNVSRNMRGDYGGISRPANAPVVRNCQNCTNGICQIPVSPTVRQAKPVAQRIEQRQRRKEVKECCPSDCKCRVDGDCKCEPDCSKCPSCCMANIGKKKPFHFSKCEYTIAEFEDATKKPIYVCYWYSFATGGEPKLANYVTNKVCIKDKAITVNESDKTICTSENAVELPYTIFVQKDGKQSLRFQK